jgi:hypothetical protein
MDEHPVTGSQSTGTPEDELRGSAWATLDETFFRIVQDAFSHVFCAGASALLASNDDAAPERPAVIQLPEADTEVALLASMHRHPSSRRRF